MEDITFDTDFFRVSYKLGLYDWETVSAPQTVAVEEGEVFQLSVALPVYLVGGEMWAVVGHNAVGDLIGFNTTTIREIPLRDTPSYIIEPIEAITVTLTTPRSYDVILSPFVGHKLTSMYDDIYYTLIIKDLEGRERELMLAVNRGIRDGIVDVDVRPEQLTED